MTTTLVAQRDATQTAACRIAAMLMGIGSVHLLAPKPFDTIVPASCPETRALHLRFGSRRDCHRSAAAAATHPAIGRAGGRHAVRRGLPGERQHVPVVVDQALADAHRRFGTAAATDSDDHHRTQNQAQQLSGPGLGRLPQKSRSIRRTCSSPFGVVLTKSAYRRRLRGLNRTPIVANVHG